MAKPDCDDGWVKLANELGAALASADLSVGERVVLWFALEGLFGPSKPRAVALPIKTIAKASGLWPTTIRRAVRSVVALGMLEPSADDPACFRLVKDYDRWRDRGRRPLFPGGRDFARSASERINGKRVTSSVPPGGSQALCPPGVTSSVPPPPIRKT